ncbi:hypothetical protein TrLO_g11374 [Triparma laevis f. longispina]|uniref:Uncharacterized protein n=1 Tax=Triparma laevis f. longispina TaxID=1714387 RepID=A0A9W7BZK2_9STRA|nr:hypothetical protein TrLO_g11374 [Triparma laevis f. longispina]
MSTAHVNDKAPKLEVKEQLTAWYESQPTPPDQLTTPPTPEEGTPRLSRVWQGVLIVGASPVPGCGVVYALTGESWYHGMGAALFSLSVSCIVLFTFASPANKDIEWGLMVYGSLWFISYLGGSAVGSLVTDKEGDTEDIRKEEVERLKVEFQRRVNAVKQEADAMADKARERVRQLEPELKESREEVEVLTGALRRQSQQQQQQQEQQQQQQLQQQQTEVELDLDLTAHSTVNVTRSLDNEEWEKSRPSREQESYDTGVMKSVRGDVEKLAVELDGVASELNGLRVTVWREQKARQLSENIGVKERAEILKVVNDDDEEEEGEGSFYDDSLFDMVEQLDDMHRC